MNLKIANYLLGDAIALKEENGYLVLCIHDYDVYMRAISYVVSVDIGDSCRYDISCLIFKFSCFTG